MIPVEAARARILGALQTTGPEVVAVSQAWGRVTAEPIVARRTQPPAAVSAMDGYAVRAVDAVAGASLSIVGAAPAGHPWTGRLAPGQAVRLFTGSAIPDGADSVLLQEDARAKDARITVGETVAAGRHIRAAGQDFAAGDVLLPAGRKLSARDVGLVAAGNHPWIAVHRRPRVALLATGDEIALPGDPVAADGVVSSNTHMLAALVQAAGGEPWLLPIVRDDRLALMRALSQAASADLLLTSGGASVGDHDLVRVALADAGGVLDFWQVAMRPGKPLLFGGIGACPVLGLPGNPVSAMVTALLFARPAIERLSGLPGEGPPTEAAVLGAPLRANDARSDFLRAKLGPDERGMIATPFAQQDSAQLQRLAQAQALILRPPHAAAAAAGEIVPVLRLDALGV